MAISGKLGTVTTAAGVTVGVKKWTFAGNAEVPKHNTNTTNGVKAGVCGPVDSKGSVEIVIDLDQDGTGDGVPWGPGESVTLTLIADKNHPATRIVTPAIISDAPLEADINGGAEQMVTYGFEGNGLWTAGGGFAKYVPGGASAATPGTNSAPALATSSPGSGGLESHADTDTDTDTDTE